MTKTDPFNGAGGIAGGRAAEGREEPADGRRKMPLLWFVRLFCMVRAGLPWIDGPRRTATGFVGARLGDVGREGTVFLPMLVSDCRKSQGQSPVAGRVITRGDAVATTRDPINLVGLTC